MPVYIISCNLNKLKVSEIGDSNVTTDVKSWNFPCHVSPNPVKHGAGKSCVCSVRFHWTPLNSPSFKLNHNKIFYCVKIWFSRLPNRCFDLGVCKLYAGPGQMQGLLGRAHVETVESSWVLLRWFLCWGLRNSLSRIIGSCLVESALTSAVCWLVIRQMPAALCLMLDACCLMY